MKKKCALLIAILLITGCGNKENSKTVKYFKDGEIVYFNPTIGISCSNYTEVNSNTGNRDGCLKWYAFLDEENAQNITLLLDHNTTAAVSSVIETSGGIRSSVKEVENSLKKDTELWKVPARLITTSEIVKIVGNSLWDSKFSTYQNFFYFDSNTNEESNACNNNSTECHFGWLYDRTGISCKKWGCLNNSSSNDTHGYWTSDEVLYKPDIWSVTFKGNIYNSFVSYSGSVLSYGIRPVISIPKSILNM